MNSWTSIYLGLKRNQNGLQKNMLSLSIFFSSFSLFVFHGNNLREYPIVGYNVQLKQCSIFQQLLVVLARVPFGNMGNFGRLSGFCCWRLLWHNPKCERHVWGFSLIHPCSAEFWINCIWLGGWAGRAQRASLQRSLPLWNSLEEG